MSVCVYLFTSFPPPFPPFPPFKVHTALATTSGVLGREFLEPRLNNPCRPYTMEESLAFYPSPFRAQAGLCLPSLSLSLFFPVLFPSFFLPFLPSFLSLSSLYVLVSLSIFSSILLCAHFPSLNALFLPLSLLSCLYSCLSVLLSVIYVLVCLSSFFKIVLYLYVCLFHSLLVLPLISSHVLPGIKSLSPDFRTWRR